MKKIVLWTAGIAALVAVWAVIFGYGGDVVDAAKEKFAEELDKGIAEGIDEAVAEMQKQIPAQVDEITTLVGVEGSRYQLAYTMQVSVLRENIDRNLLRENFVQNLCGESDVKFLLDNDVVYHYTFIGEEKEPYFTFQVVKDDC